MEKRKPIFMIHKHHASKLHFDLRIEIDNKLKSFAMYQIPIKPTKPISATQVADHPMWYRHFEGVIPEGEYGAGPVIVWEKGLYSIFNVNHQFKKLTPTEALKDGILFLWLEGHKLKGSYILIRISKKQKWLFIKMNDEFVIKQKPKNWNRSIKSNKTLDEVYKKYQKKLKNII